MTINSSILLGFVRFCLMILFFYYLNRKFINSKINVSYFDFLANKWFKYGSLTLILIFLLVQFNIYNLFNVIFILIIIVFIGSVGRKNILKPILFSTKKIKRSIFEFLKNVELQKKISFFILPKINSENRVTILTLLFTVVFLGIITFASRYFFFKFDLYSLSDLWSSDLETVIDFDSQNWFLKGVYPVGEYALINFYGKLASVSPEIALETMGILEAVLLCVLLFWTISKITNSRTIAPLIASLLFAIFYTITPINISYVLQHKAMFLAISLGLPTMVFYLKPDLLKWNKKTYFFNFLFAFTAIGLIDLFSLIVLMIPFVILGIPFTNIKHKKYNLIGIGSLLVSLVVLATIYGLACVSFENDILLFFHSSLMSVSAYNYFPHLIFPYEKLIQYYQYSSLIGILLTLKFIIINKEDWNASLYFLVYFNIIIFIGNINNGWIDTDMIKQSTTIFIPIIIGITIASILRLLVPVYKKVLFVKPYIVALSIVGILFSAVYFQKEEFTKLDITDSTSRKILNTYDKINATYFPLTYAVINDYSTQSISIKKHLFINYSDFLSDYAERDSIYFKNVKNKKFFVKHPEYILPNSVLIFVFIKKTKGNNLITHNIKFTPQLMSQINRLKQKGRKIELFYENDIFKVYEIINKPRQSRIDDLIF